MQLCDFIVGEAEFLEHLVGVLAEFGRRGRDLARRARQRERLTDEGLFLAVGPVAFFAIPKCLTCSSANTWSIVLIGPQGTPAALRTSINSALVLLTVMASIAALTASRFFKRAAPFLKSSRVMNSGAPIAAHRRSHMTWPAVAMLM